MRIMELYRIESQFKNHKKRLQKIKKLNSQEKILKMTSHHFYVASEHKKIKINAQTFHQKEEAIRREHHNSLMHKTISDHTKRIKQHHELSFVGLNNNQIMIKNVPKTSEIEKIEYQNALLKDKIDKMKSVYHNFRRNSQYNATSRTQRETIRNSQKEKLMKLLKNQFKIEPNVMFPRCKSKTINLETHENVDSRKRQQTIDAPQENHSEELHPPKNIQI